MRSVRNAGGAAWEPSGRQYRPLIRALIVAVRAGQSTQANTSPLGRSLGAAMNDLLVIGMTIVIFAVFFILVRVVEHIER
jgi:hypothetical protein